jgi:hypothetical protein
MKNIIYTILLVCLTLISCSESDNEIVSVETTLQLGTVKGVVTTPANKVVPNATVFYDDNGEVYITKTNTLGEFTLELPSGTRSIEIQTGNGKLFRSSYEVIITPNSIVDLSAETFRLEAEASFAYLDGTNDSIESVIQGLGYTVDELEVSDIEGANGLDDYSALFLNCDNNTAVFSNAFYQNINNFVARGGSLYASDYALEYLVGYDAYAQNCTTVRQGGFIDDALVCGTRSGAEGWLNGNTVVDEDLNDFTSFISLNVEYDLDIWMKLQTADTDFWTVLVEDVNQAPLMIKTNQLNTNINEADWYSNNGNKVTICHIPPGNPENAHPITISVNALQPHLDHGCYVGSCNATSGSIYYTTFHNHIDGSATPEITQIMEYMILNL